MKDSQKCLWLWDPVNYAWVKAACTPDGKLMTYDEYQWVPKVNMTETWQDEAGIDPVMWDITDPATGAAWARGPVGTRLAAHTTPNANETARLRYNMPWVINPAHYGETMLLQKIKLYFECLAITVPNIDNTQTILGGFTSGGIATRATNNIIGFGLFGDQLQFFSDNGGAETVVNDGTAFGVEFLKLGMEISAGEAKFYINEQYRGTIDTNLFELPAYLNFYIDTEAGGAASLSIGQIMVITEVKLR